MKDFLFKLMLLISGIALIHYFLQRKNKNGKFFNNIKRKIDSIDKDEVEDKVKDFIVEKLRSDSVQVNKWIAQLLAFASSNLPKDTLNNTNVRKEVKRVVRSKSVKVGSLNSRQVKILEMINKKGELSVADVSEMFKKVSSRTLRRDFDVLEKLDKVSQMGKTRNSIYVPKKA